MTPPQFVNTSPEAILADLISEFESITGRTLLPAQPEMQILNAAALQIYARALQFQSGAQNMLVNFATGAALDELAAFLDVSRLPASAASVTMTFALAPSPTGTVILAGTRISTPDGRASFATSATVTVPPLATSATAVAFATETGPGGNNYAPGTITRIQDPAPFLLSATNSDTSGGGVDAENDEQLRARVLLAPSRFSTAGSRSAYRFWTFTVSPAIVDVAVEQIVPGTVGVWPLVLGGATPAGILNLVEAVLSGDDVIPLTDTVVVASPDRVATDIEVEITALEGADAAQVQAAATAALEAMKAAKQSRLGQDVVVAQITAAALVPGAYNVVVVEPSADVEVESSEVAEIGTITVTITGFNPG
jgi:phage-related baseplate assembly protein